MVGQKLTVEPVRVLEDAYSAMSIDRLIFAKPTPKEIFIRAHTDQTTYIFSVARRESRTIVGFILATVIKEEAEIISLGVVPSMRKMGIGVALISALIETATKRGAQRLLLEVRPSNRAALALYRSTGFKELAIRRDYYPDPIENALILWRPLETEIAL